MSIAARFTAFEGQTVLVTGGAKGIGAGIVTAFVETGANVVFGYNSSEDAAQALTESTGARGVRADITDPSAAAHLLESCGPVDVLINNAGIYPLKPLLDLDDDAWRGTLNVNLDAAARLTREVARAMVDRGAKGRIVNISSIEAHAPGAMHAHYSAAKAALEMFTRAAAQELGSHGIRVNAVAPGLIDYPELASLWPEGVERWKRTAPLGRLGTRRDVADACVYLCSEAASFVTGATLVVDGGVLSTSAF